MSEFKQHARNKAIGTEVAQSQGDTRKPPGASLAHNRAASITSLHAQLGAPLIEADLMPPGMQVTLQAQQDRPKRTNLILTY
jgi:hypothetical protein